MLTLTFPPEVVLPANPQVYPQFGFSGTPTYSASGNILKIVGGFPSLNGIRFRIINLVNPGSALNLQGFTFKFYSSTLSVTPIDQSQTSSGFFFQYTTDTLIGGNIVPASYTVGDYCTWTLQITPKNQIPAGGILKLFMPKWIDSTIHSITPLSMLPSGSNACSAGTGLTSTSLTCTFYRDPSSTGIDSLTINNAFATAQSGNNYFEIKISNFRNMPTTRPYSNFEIWTYDANGYGIDNLKPIEVGMLSPAILPNNMASVIIEAPTTVDALTTYLFQIFVQNPIPTGGTIRIRIPSTIGATYLTSVISKQRVNLNVQRTYPVSSDTNFIELTGAFPTVAESVPLSAVVAFQLFKLKNPSTPSLTTSFEITTYETYQGQQYPIETITTGLQVAGSSGKITMNSYTFSELRVLEYNSFTFNLVLQNALSAGCSVQIQFPSEFLIPDVATGSCRLIGVYGISSSSTCQFTQNKMVISDPFGSTDSKGSDNIRFTIGNNYVRNPTSTRPTTTGIVIKSVSASGNPIDDWSGNKFTATENSLSSVTVTPSSYVAGDYPVQYSFTLRTPYQVEANAFIYVKFPTGDLSVYDTSIAADKCVAVATLSQSNIKCSAKQTELTISKGFPSGICACLGDITFQVGGIINPRSLKTTQTFTVSIFSSDNYLIYSKKTGITLKMTDPDRQSTVTITQVQAQNGAKDQYIFAVQNHNENVDGDVINIYFPPEISISNDTTCGARFGVRGFYKCSQDKTKTNVMTVSLAFSQRILASSAIGRGYEFLLTNILNAPSMAPTSQFTVLINDVDGFNISTITNGLIVANKKPSNMTSVSIKPSVYSDGKWTNLTFSVIPKNYMQFMTMTIQIPPDVLIAQAAPNLCQVISTYSISKEMVCDYQPGTRTIRILNGFQTLTKTQFDLSSILLRTLQFMIGQFINPVGVTKSGDFIFTTYDKQGYIIDQLRQPISYVCSPLCGACSSDDYTKCISCPKNSTFKLLYMGQCVQTCPTGTTEQSNKCLVCSSGCQDCSSENDTCITCAKNFFTLQGACVGSCPSSFTLELPNKCVSPVIPVFTFISYFQKRNDYQCFMFPLSAATILITIVMWLAVCCSKCLVSRKREQLIQQEIKPPGFLTPLRLVEICIALISILELGGWGFFLYCMLDLQDKLPFYVICGALGLNLFLNFIMTCGIMRSKSNYDRYIQKYQQSNSCTYRIIQCLSLLVSHKWFYISFTRYQRNRDRPSQFDFSYFDSGDEDGVSGICFKFFFLASVLLLHGVVIAACVLNYLSNDLTKKVFCLDLDIIGMTGFQALLILLTLLQCGSVSKEPQRVFPLDNDLDGKKKLNQTSAKSIDVDEEEMEQKPPKRDKKGRIIPEENIKGSSKKGSKRNADEENPFSKKTRRGKDDDPDFTRNLDRTIDPLDEDDIKSRPRGSKKANNNYIGKGKDSDIDDGFQTIDHRQKSKKKGGQENEESDSAEDITNSVQKKKKKQSKKGEQDSDSSDDVQGPNNSKKSKNKKNKRGIEDQEEESDQESEYDNRGNKIQNKKKHKKPKNKSGQFSSEDDSNDDSFDDDSHPKSKSKNKKPKKKQANGQNNESDEPSEEDSYGSQQNASRPKKNKQKKKKLVKNDKGKLIEIEETDSDEESDEDIQQPGQKNKKKPKKQKKKKLVKNAKGQMIEIEETDSEEESDQQSSDDQQQPGSKKPKKPKKKKAKKIVKNAKGQMVEVTESSEESEQDDSDDDQPVGKKAKKKKKSKKKKVRNEKGSIVEVTDSEASSEEEEDDSDDQQPGKQQKAKKKKDKKPKKIKVKNEKGQIIEVTASEESSEQSEDDDQEQPGQFNKKKTKNKKKASKKAKKQGGRANQVESDEIEESEEELDDPSIPPSERKPKKKKPAKKKKKVVNKDGTISVIEEVSEEEEIEVSEYYDEQVDPNEDQTTGAPLLPGQVGKPKAVKKKKKKVVKKKKKVDTTGLNYEEVSHNATSDDELGQQKGIKFDKVRVDKEMQKLHEEIADGDEPSYRELVDQINHEEGRRQPTLTAEVIRNPSAKFGTIFKDTKQQDEMQHQERVSAKFGVVHNSIPTEHDEEHIEHNNADFGQIKSSYPTQYDEKFLESTQPVVFEQDDASESAIKQGSQKSPSKSKKPLKQPKDNLNQHESPSSSGSQQLEDDSNNGQVEGKPNRKSDKQNKPKNNQVQNTNLNDQQSNDSDIEQNDISGSISSNKNNEGPKDKQLKDKKLKSPQKGASNLPEEAQSQFIQSKDKFKSPSMSLENNATQEQRSVNKIKQGSANKKLQNQDQQEDTHEDNEEDEKNDKVNQDDIKPKTKIIFSDKSESSVEDLMEDTPSNYNVLNGRLDEDSKGLRSVMYKAISKKALYQNILDKSSQNLQPGAEDHEARQITSNGGQKKSAGRPPSTSSSSKIKKREQAKLFIQKAENAGISTLNEGSNLLQQQIQMTQSVARHQRNASIGDITSSKLMDEDNNQLDPNNINKYASQMLIIPNTDTSANQK